MATPIDEIPFFKGLSAQDLVSIMGITRTIQYEKDANIFNQDDPSNGLYVLLKGKLQIYIRSGHIGGTSKVVATLAPGQYVGEFGLIDGENRSASVKMVEEGEVLFLPSLAFGSIMDKHPQIADAVCGFLCDRIMSLPKLKLTSGKAVLIREKRVKPDLQNMKTLCQIVREFNRQTAVKEKG
jgi:CRP/FNR family transcriptional regulator